MLCVLARVAPALVRMSYVNKCYIQPPSLSFARRVRRRKCVGACVGAHVGVRECARWCVWVPALVRVGGSPFVRIAPSALVCVCVCVCILALLVRAG